MPDHSAPNQTLSFLMRRFAEAGIHPRGKLGQNFLIDLNLQRLLLESAQLGPNDVVLEVGTGTGSLTVLMAGQAGKVVTVELDQQLYQLAGEELFDMDNVVMLQHDILKNKNLLNPAVMEVVAKQLAADSGRQLKLVSNLPYNVATPIVTNLLATDTPPTLMVITIQKELADRMTAAPRSKDYGALSIWMQSQCRVEVVRMMPPTVFWPRPKVTSAIVRIEFDRDLRARIPNLKFFHGFVRSMFFHRRKFLRSNLLGAFKGQLSKPQVDGIMVGQQIEGNARSEELDVDAMLDLAVAVAAELGD